jgi:hypothetical protein
MSPTWIGTCRRGHSVQAGHDAYRMGWITCPCGAQVIAKVLHVSIKETKCGLRCTSALGPNCDCSCGGKRHGSDLWFAGAQT